MRAVQDVALRRLVVEILDEHPGEVHPNDIVRLVALRRPEIKRDAVYQALSDLWGREFQVDRQRTGYRLNLTGRAWLRHQRALEAKTARGGELW